eukprot:3807418-Amphidinium_carterae.1
MATDSEMERGVANDKSGLHRHACKVSAQAAVPMRRESIWPKAFLLIDEELHSLVFDKGEGACGLWVREDCGCRRFATPGQRCAPAETKLNWYAPPCP